MKVTAHFSKASARWPLERTKETNLGDACGRGNEAAAGHSRVSGGKAHMKVVTLEECMPTLPVLAGLHSQDATNVRVLA